MLLIPKKNLQDTPDLIREKKKRRENDDDPDKQKEINQ